MLKFWFSFTISFRYFCIKIECIFLIKNISLDLFYRALSRRNKCCKMDLSIIFICEGPLFTLTICILDAIYYVLKKNLSLAISIMFLPLNTSVTFIWKCISIDLLSPQYPLPLRTLTFIPVQRKWSAAHSFRRNYSFILIFSARFSFYWRIA